jgi:hypothetical protein
MVIDSHHSVVKLAHISDIACSGFDARQNVNGRTPPFVCS